MGLDEIKEPPNMQTIRPAAVAGMFYPAEGGVLAGQVQAMLHAAAQDAGTDVALAPPKAIVVPHAGYVYSGQTAARAYARLLPLRYSIRRVVLVGPAHRVPLQGLALPQADAFETPLGKVEIDQLAVSRLRGFPQVTVSAAAHSQEHALEVQLPFLQAVLDDFKLVPLVVGRATPAEVAGVLEAVWGGTETLIVISSDLSHFLPYELAQEVDQATVDKVLALQDTLTPQQACGGAGVNGLIHAARSHGLQPHLLQFCNSGDTAGDKARVVGYAAFLFTPAEVH